MGKVKSTIQHIGIPVYDSKKREMVWAKSNKHYLELVVELYGRHYKKKEFTAHYPRLKKDARLLLAKNYIACHNLIGARKQYEKLARNGWHNEANEGLANIAFLEKQYETALLYLQKIDTHNAQSHFLKVRALFATGDLENVFKPLQKAFELAPNDEQILLIRATFFEHYYRTTLQDLKYLQQAIDSYELLFEQTLFKQQLLNQGKYVSMKQCHYCYGNYIVLLLEADQPAIAIQAIERYFSLIALPEKDDDSRLASSLFVQAPTEYTELLPTAEQLQLEQAYKKTMIQAYRKQSMLLLELLAYAHLLIGKRDEALQVITELTLLSYEKEELQIRLQKLKAIERGAITFHPEGYLKRLQKFHDKFEMKLNKVYEPVTRQHIMHTFALLKHQFDVLEQQGNLQLLHEAVGEYYNMRRYILEVTMKDNWVPEDKATAKILNSLQQAVAEADVDYELENPLPRFERLAFLEKVWQAYRLPLLLEPSPLPLPSKTEREKTEKNQLNISRYQNILELWVKAEQYYASLQVLYTNDPQNANMLIDTYFKVLELWLVKLLGEICDGDILSSGEKRQYIIGKLDYYMNSTLSNYRYFIEIHKTLYIKPSTKDGRNPKHMKLGKKGFKKFINWRNESFHKIPFTVQEVQEIRTLFYKCIVLLMDALRDLDDDYLNKYVK